MAFRGYVDVKNLTKAGAKTIYRGYWKAVLGDELPETLAIVLFDAAVNHGVKRAVLLFQEALKVRRDGVVGPKTIAAARAYGMSCLVLFLRLRARFYVTLATRKPVHKEHLDGWLTRLFRAQQRALAEAA